MRFFTRSKPTEAVRVPTDTVLQAPLWDDRDLGRQLCLHYSYRFNDVLDAGELRKALERLLQIGEWRRLGARIRLNSNGRVEYHIPAQYDDKRAGFTFNVTKHAIPIDEHPLAANLPRGTSKPSLQGNPEDMVKSLCLHPQHPRTLDDWLHSDRPLFDVHIVVFEDATLLSISFMHLVTGASGIRQIFRAWSAVLNGREEEVGTLRGVGDDLLADHSHETAPTEFVNYGKRLTRFQKIVFAIYALWDRIWFPAAECRLICIPGAYVDRVRDQAIQDLSQRAEIKHGPPFISDGDTLLSWCTRTVVKSLGASPSRRVSVFNVFDTRATLLQTNASDNTAFITNACVSASTFMSVADVINRPIGDLAWQFRTALTQQRTKTQCQAQLAARRVTLSETGSSPVFTDATSLLVGCSNWHRARFYDIDFSSAVHSAKSHLGGQTKRLGRPVSIMTHRDLAGPQLRNIGTVYGKDSDGNWWLVWKLRNQAWPAFEQELENLSRQAEER